MQRYKVFLLALSFFSSFSFSQEADWERGLAGSELTAADYCEVLANAGYETRVRHISGDSWWCEYRTPDCPPNEVMNPENEQCYDVECHNNGFRNAHSLNGDDCYCDSGEKAVNDFLGRGYSVCTPQPEEECSPSHPHYINTVSSDGVTTDICDFSDGNGCPENHGTATVNGEVFCYPHSEDTCLSGQTNVDGVCLDNESLEQDPDQDKPESDLDNDGVPNHSDPDIDGDGIPNSEDLYPEGSGSGASGGSAVSSSANASGACSTRPSCDGGDPANCAILIQQWEAMCYVENSEYSETKYYEGNEDHEQALKDSVTGFKSHIENSDTINHVKGFLEVDSSGVCYAPAADLGVLGSIDMSVWCDFDWELIGNIFLLIGAFAAFKVALM
jgi:hypothetical protein